MTNYYLKFVNCLALLVFCVLLPKVANAQREIEFYEPDFDYDYCLHTSIYEDIIEPSYYPTCFSQFFSKTCKQKKISEIKKTENVKRNKNEYYSTGLATYNDGYLASEEIYGGINNGKNKKYSISYTTLNDYRYRDVNSGGLIITKNTTHVSVNAYEKDTTHHKAIYYFNASRQLDSLQTDDKIVVFEHDSLNHIVKINVFHWGIFSISFNFSYNYYNGDIDIIMPPQIRKYLANAGEKNTVAYFILGGFDSQHDNAEQKQLEMSYSENLIGFNKHWQIGTPHTFTKGTIYFENKKPIFFENTEATLGYDSYELFYKKNNKWYAKKGETCGIYDENNLIKLFKYSGKTVKYTYKVTL